MNLIEKLQKKELIHPPSFLPVNTHYLVVMGSVAYGVSSDNSDQDIYGFCIPPKEDVFPTLRGEIPGFGRQKSRFDVWQEHHIKDEMERKQYDFCVYSIVRYFDLCMENNPNMIDSLFVPQRCVLYCPAVGNLVRENRKTFLHRGCWHKFKGYAYAQMHKMDGSVVEVEDPETGELKLVRVKKQNPKREADYEKHGYDLKFAYHIVRLLSEVEQILVEGDLDLERNREQLKSIRRGEWSRKQIVDYFADKEKSLEEVYNKSTLPYGPDEDKIKELLLNCLEMHYGSLSKAIEKPNAYSSLVNDLAALVEKHRKK
jgi:predicted nucleotidyltransferase